MSGSELVRQLKQLAELHGSGAITADEFTAAKAHLLHSQDRTAEPAALPEQFAWSEYANTDGQPPAQPDPASPLPRQLSVPAVPGTPPNAVPGQGRTTTPREGARPRPAALAALAGGLIALLAFLAMPLATAPFLGSITGAGLAGLASEEGSFGLLWLVPLAAAAVAGIGAWQQFAQSIPLVTRRRGSVAVLVLAGVTVVAYLVVLGVVQSKISQTGASRLGVSGAGLTGAGFWFALLGMLTAAVAAAADLMGLRTASEAHRVDETRP